VLQRLSQRLGSEQVALELETLHLAATRVDIAAARARYSHALGGTPPVFSDVRTDGLRLPRLFHPLLLAPRPGEPPQPAGVVPQDYELPSHVRAVVVTGPNTGGKTVALKNLGLAALMAKAGLWPVCSQGGPDGPPARVPWFDVVMADIGDEQSLVQSLSTFSAHVARIKSILAHATPSSLVLLDEVGAGTDPTEGSALGAAVLRRLADRAALTMCTTHHSSLKTLKYNDRAFENACVEFDDVRMAPTYRLLWGIPGRSNAISIARRLGLQEDVLSDAVAALGSGEADVTRLIQRMQQEQAEQRELREQLAALRDEAAAARDEMRRQAEAQAGREAAAAAAQQEAFAAEMAEAREQLTGLIADARASGAQATGSQTMHELAQIGRRAAAKSSGAGAGGGGEVGGEAGAAAGGGEVEVGDRVVVPRLGDAAVVVSERKGKQLTVAFGGLTMKVKLGEVTELIKAEPVPQPRKVPAVKRERTGTTAIKLQTNTLDIRGMRPTDVSDALARAIDRALDLGTLYVVHGRGTGALRASVREALAEEPMVARFADAPEAEGGNGCTIAYLK
jgi:DNA mismatch repair protein MutS2